jgi:hypothetical protein
VVAATATAVPEGTPSATSFKQEPQPVEPMLASQGGRPDCPTGWLVWNETKNRFSVCYPPSVPDGLEALSYASATSPSDQVLWLHTPAQTNRDTASVVLSLTASIQTLPALSKDTPCVGLVPGQIVPGTREQFVHNGRAALSCEARGEDFIQGRLRPLSVIVFQANLGGVGEGSYVVIVGHYHSGPGKQESRITVDAILKTLTIR